MLGRTQGACSAPEHQQKWKWFKLEPRPSHLLDYSETIIAVVSQPPPKSHKSILVSRSECLLYCCCTVQYSTFQLCFFCDCDINCVCDFGCDFGCDCDWSPLPQQRATFQPPSLASPPSPPFKIAFSSIIIIFTVLGWHYSINFALF